MIPRSLLRPLGAALAALTLLTPALAGTLTVGAPASGAQFTDIAAAIAAAQPGDTILVDAGTYLDAPPLVIDKPLTLLGAGSSATIFRALPADPFDQPVPLTITGLAAGEQVRVGGLQLRSQALGGIPARSVVVEDCAGLVTLVDLANQDDAADIGTDGRVLVRNAAQVVLDTCTFDGGSSAAVTAPALRVEGSRVVVNGTVLRGGNAASLPTPVATPDGAPGVLAIDSDVWIARSIVVGGNGSFASFGLPGDLNSAGGAGVAAQGSSLELWGGPGNQILGGQGVLSMASGQVDDSTGGPAVELDAASGLVRTVDLALVPGFDGSGGQTAAEIAGTGSVTALPTELASMLAIAPIVAPGSPALYLISGEPNAVGLTFVAYGQAAAQPLPFVEGDALLAPGFVYLRTTSLSSLGSGLVSQTVPANPNLIGKVAVLQTYMVGPSGTQSISAPMVVAVR